MFGRRAEVRQLRERIAELEEALADERARSVIRIYLTKEDKEEMAEMVLERYLESGGGDAA